MMSLVKDLKDMVYVIKDGLLTECLCYFCLYVIDIYTVFKSEPKTQEYLSLKT